MIRRHDNLASPAIPKRLWMNLLYYTMREQGCMDLFLRLPGSFHRTTQPETSEQHDRLSSKMRTSQTATGPADRATRPMRTRPKEYRPSNNVYRPPNNFLSGNPDSRKIMPATCSESRNSVGNDRSIESRRCDRRSSIVAAQCDQSARRRRIDQNPIRSTTNGQNMQEEWKEGL